jgi:gamma-glutamyltranspeptidase/glutathione hydrolase
MTSPAPAPARAPANAAATVATVAAFAAVVALAALCASPWTSASPAQAASQPPTRSRLGVVASDSEVASAVGAQILAEGGNAADAAVGVMVALGLTHPFASGLGGGGFCIVREATTQAVTVHDFREVAPAAAHRDMYLTPEGDPQPSLSVVGGLAVAVPGEPAGLAVLQRHGRRTLAQNLAPTIALARDGYPASSLMEKRVTDQQAAIRAAHPALGAWLLPDGQPPEAEATLRNVALATTLEALGAHGPEVFYTGDMAAHIARAVAASGGVLTTDDLRAYKPTTRAPLRGVYRGHEVITMPPPSSGGTTLLATLAILEGFDLKAMGHNSSAALHHTAEALKFAFADRAQHLADPDHHPVPVERLLSPAVAAARRARIKPDATLPRDAYAEVPTALPDDDGTSHFSILDADDNMVACTTTINTAFGSFVYVPELGVLLNNEMDDFVQKPGVPNAFGLIGAEANAIEPGKRPLSSMSPTLVLKDGQPLMIVGASGGPTIITATLQALLNVIDFGMDPRAAVEAPRIHHQWVPEVLVVEPEVPADVQESLKARGHVIKVMPAFSAAQAVVARPPFRFAASDPRKHGVPAAQPRVPSPLRAPAPAPSAP